MAFACFIRWGHLLLLLRGFATFGPLILPIINSVRQTQSFVVVCVLLLGAIFHGQVAILPSRDDWGSKLLMKYQLAMHHETKEKPTADDDSAVVVYFLFFTASVVVGIYTLNLGISILSSRYDANVELADREFLRVRCALLGTYAVTIRQLPSFILATQHSVADDDTADVENDDDLLRKLGRMQSLKQSTTQQLKQMESRLGGRMQAIEARLAVIERHNSERVQQQDGVHQLLSALAGLEERLGGRLERLEARVLTRKSASNADPDLQAPLSAALDAPLVMSEVAPTIPWEDEEDGERLITAL